MKKGILRTVVIMCIIFVAAPAFAAGSLHQCRGQMVLAPAAYYDRSYMKGGELVVSIQDSMLSIVNLDLANKIKLMTVRLIDSDQNVIKDYLPEPITLDPLQGGHFFANPQNLGIDRFPFSPIPPFPGDMLYFLVEWKAEVTVTAPAIGSASLFLLVDGDGPGARPLSITPHTSKVIKEKKKWLPF
jgi:hypothetical protein